MDSIRNRLRGEFPAFPTSGNCERRLKAVTARRTRPWPTGYQPSDRRLTPAASGLGPRGSGFGRVGIRNPPRQRPALGVEPLVRAAFDRRPVLTRWEAAAIIGTRCFDRRKIGRSGSGFTTPSPAGVGRGTKSPTLGVFHRTHAPDGGFVGRSRTKHGWFDQQMFVVGQTVYGPLVSHGAGNGLTIVNSGAAGVDRGPP